MLKWAARLFTSRATATRAVMPPPPRRVVVTSACVESIRAALWDATARRHEGIVYLFGLTDGFVTLIAAAFRPEAVTTEGSFHVDLMGMRQVIETANRYGLQVVGQMHTHPAVAFHSEGDVEGALIRFGGFVSIVAPDYGVHLPSFAGAAIYMFSRAGRAFVALKVSDLHILQEFLP
jgi:proteasome lid subunit RPN8/RPN11